MKKITSLKRKPFLILLLFGILLSSCNNNSKEKENLQSKEKKEKVEKTKKIEKEIELKKEEETKGNIDLILEKLEEIQLPKKLIIDDFSKYYKINNLEFRQFLPTIFEEQTFVNPIYKLTTKENDSFVIFLTNTPEELYGELEDSPNIYLGKIKNGQISENTIWLTYNNIYEHQNAYINKENRMTTLYSSENEGVHVSYELYILENHTFKKVKSSEKQFTQEKYGKSYAKKAVDYKSNLIERFKNKGIYK
ncbi:hypothetical protein [Aureivirga sp. CE67]|uniref:hypothetical protein n=1 Tax=Aureivirga sp. CE67 TaxID=1788983 RepID=UPI0018C8F343|nr:hypothetical protein [Aureivirga sp. CE67]